MYTTRANQDTYYAPRGTKRKVPHDEDMGIDAFPSLAEMAALGQSFKLDWGNTSDTVTVFTEEEKIWEDETAGPIETVGEEEENMIDEAEFTTGQENRRIMATPTSIRLKFLDRLRNVLTPGP
ncbi:hypothetical protein DRE_06472 [Drechslerella stenobrocha 248]|uniref:Uncharacterized protein n=1 Tax=Drechslerella stenobrocha 248 TaxID=1043628 RepID=W7HNW4_9PEZI|nr:hypothetical protein DRE_06472 [Drechslerella stenobrocha 248]